MNEEDNIHKINNIFEADNIESVEDTNKFISVSEAAKILGVSTSTVRRLSDQGQVRAFRVGLGKHRRYILKEIIELLKSFEENNYV